MSSFTVQRQVLETIYDISVQHMFCLAFLFTTSVEESIDIIKTVFYDLCTNHKMYLYAQSSNNALLRLTYRACQKHMMKRYHKRNTLKRLSTMQFPFQSSEPLLQFLTKAESLKIACALHNSMKLSVPEISKIMNISTGKVSRLLQIGANSQTELEIADAVSLITISASSAQRLYDKIIGSIYDMGFIRKQQWRRFKSHLDSAVPILAIFVLAFFLFAYLTVRFGWLG